MQKTANLHTRTHSGLSQTAPGLTFIPALMYLVRLIRQQILIE
jgi:hypothetical protein